MNQSLSIQADEGVSYVVCVLATWATHLEEVHVGLSPPRLDPMLTDRCTTDARPKAVLLGHLERWVERREIYLSVRPPRVV